MKTPNICIVSIDSIEKNPDNPRTIKDVSFKKLVQSIKSFPEMLNIRPIVIDANNMILGGNMRYEACKQAGLKEVPILKADKLTEDQKKQFIIKDNISNGEWDIDKLINEWDVELLKEWDLTLPELNIDNDESESDGEELKEIFKLEVDCETEEKQEKLFNELTKKGYSCRLLTL